MKWHRYKYEIGTKLEEYNNNERINIMNWIVEVFFYFNIIIDEIFDTARVQTIARFICTTKYFQRYIYYTRILVCEYCQEIYKVAVGLVSERWKFHSKNMSEWMKIFLHLYKF